MSCLKSDLNLIVLIIAFYLQVRNIKGKNKKLFFFLLEYQLQDNDFESTKSVCEALIHRLHMLIQLADLESNHITKTNNMHTSMETDETTTVRNPCKLSINFFLLISVTYLLK